MAEFVRRGNLVAPYGVGSLHAGLGGETYLVAGLDQWFQREFSRYITAADGRLFPQEFDLDEPRLADFIGGRSLRQPPDWRESNSADGVNPIAKINMGLTVPMLRFPAWRYCSSNKCKRLFRADPWAKDPASCPDEAHQSYVMSSKQVFLVVACVDGHLGEFPWVDFVHRGELNPCLEAKAVLRLTHAATTGLAAYTLKCDQCHAQQKLLGVLGLEEDGPASGSTSMGRIAKLLNPGGKPTKCTGPMAWLGRSDGITPCDRSPVALLRGGSNLYYPDTVSALALRRAAGHNDFSDLVNANIFLKLIWESLIQSNDNSPEEIVQQLRDLEEIKHYLEGVSDQEILDHASRVEVDEKSTTNVQGIELRGSEFSALISQHDLPHLKVKIQQLTHQAPSSFQFRSTISAVNQVSKLMETRVLRGFSRIRPTSQFDQYDVERRISQLSRSKVDWLPAVTTQGEGLFIQLEEDQVKNWEQNPAVVERHRLVRGIGNPLRSGMPSISPRYILIHSLSHALMRTLATNVGYSLSSLRERLYSNPDLGHTGVLIYTSEGDSEGSLGGLVERGVLTEFGLTVRSALNAISWCSADPVCSEPPISRLDKRENLAACHACLMVPETTCEGFNVALDRRSLLSDEGSGSGFFDKEFGSI